MKAREALRELADVSASQWGMVTSAQAAMRGVTRLDLSRLAESGDLVRLAHGVYKDAGAPSGAHLDVRAAWLSSEPARLASDRLADGHRGIVVSGQTAARLHDIGDLRSPRTELTAPVRRQTQRADLHYRHRELDERDVTIRDGLPVTIPERTIADLVESRTDMSLVGDALRDASQKSQLDLARLSEKLSPLAERNSTRKDDGAELLSKLLVIAGIDPNSIAQQIASFDGIGALVTRNYLAHMPMVDISSLIDTSVIQSAIQAAIPKIDISGLIDTSVFQSAIRAAIPKFDVGNLIDTTAIQSVMRAAIPQVPQLESLHAALNTVSAATTVALTKSTTGENHT
jgi:predicted transcriptional regulator of viral defense system